MTDGTEEAKTPGLERGRGRSRISTRLNRLSSAEQKLRPMTLRLNKGESSDNEELTTPTNASSERFSLGNERNRSAVGGQRLGLRRM